VCRDEARILERAGLGEFPEYFTGLFSGETKPVGFVMRHARMFSHRRGVLQIVLRRSQKEFMIFGADVPDNEFDLLPRFTSMTDGE
jgi:hypothetical protein